MTETTTPKQGDKFLLPSGNTVRVVATNPTPASIACEYIGYPAPTGGASFTEEFLRKCAVEVV